MKTLERKGFVTIATGQMRYYNMAYNLLMSYKRNAKCKYPFAIIAETENKYTQQFDYVILMDNPCHSFNDKLRLFEYLPFDETIFIDADSLIYDDLNIWWERFSEASDFSAFGIVHKPTSDKGWFMASGMKEFCSDIKYIPMYNGGVYYLRNTKTCEKVFDIAQHCANNYNEYAFNMFKKPADEPVLALGMVLCDCYPIMNEVGSQVEYVFAPQSKRLKVDILKPKAIYHRDDKTVRPRIIHWSNYLAQKDVYRFEVWKLNHPNQNGIFVFLIKCVFKICNLRAIGKRYYKAVRRRIKI